MKTKHWIQLLLFLSIISLGVFAALYEKSKLTDCYQHSKAIIINKDRRIKRGYFIKYQYSVKGKVYTTSESLDKEKEDNVFVGDTINIIVSCSDNNVSSFNNKNLYINENNN